MGKKNDNFSHFAKHRFLKTNVLLQPPFWPTIGVFQLCFFQPKALVLNKKHNLKSGKSKDKKRDWKGKQDRKKDKIDEKSCNLMFWCCSFHETKAKKKERERKREKQGTKRKQNKKDKKEKKKEKNKRETEKEELEKGEAKKG